MSFWEKCRVILKDKKIIGLPLKASQVTVLRQPNEFYECLLNKCDAVQKRIVIASLYIGTGPLEDEFLSRISHRCQANPSMSVHVLLDGLRGSRGMINSRTMLLPLIKDHHIKVSMYQIPSYRGILRFIIPDRYNEILGVQHMKLYLFDDDLIITGANLSNDYFTNRQDRYIVINNCPSLGDFVQDLVSKVSDLSFQLNSDNELKFKSGWKYHPITSKFKDFTQNAKNYICDFYSEFKLKSSPESEDKYDTMIYPLLEMGIFGIHQESQATRELIENLTAESQVMLATGYFNITKDLADSIVMRSRAFFHLVMAHPKANGFYNAKGPAGGITKGYSELSGRFYDLVKLHDQQNRVKLSEFLRPNWTFHSKGLWLLPHASAFPILTLIGSPNFGERSYHRDLECQFLLATSNSNLQKALNEEVGELYRFSSPYTSVERGRSPPLLEFFIMFLFLEVVSKIQEIVFIYSSAREKSWKHCVWEWSDYKLKPIARDPDTVHLILIIPQLVPENFPQKRVGNLKVTVIVR